LPTTLWGPLGARISLLPARWCLGGHCGRPPIQGNRGLQASRCLSRNWGKQPRRHKSHLLLLPPWVAWGSVWLLLFGQPGHLPLSAGLPMGLGLRPGCLCGCIAHRWKRIRPPAVALLFTRLLLGPHKGLAASCDLTSRASHGNPANTRPCNAARVGSQRVCDARGSWSLLAAAVLAGLPNDTKTGARCQARSCLRSTSTVCGKMFSTTEDAMSAAARSHPPTVSTAEAADNAGMSCCEDGPAPSAH
jgi:hypothetical protein